MAALRSALWSVAVEKRQVRTFHGLLQLGLLVLEVEGREDHRDPEEAGGRFGEESAVGVKGEGEDDQHQQRVRGNLVGRDPRAQLDAKVLSGHERSVTKHAAAPDL